MGGVAKKTVLFGVLALSALCVLATLACSARDGSAETPRSVLKTQTDPRAADTAAPSKAESNDGADTAGPLSPEASKLVAGLELTRPVKIEAFISPDMPESYAQARLDLTAILREVDTLGGEMIQVRIVSTEPFGEEAVRAEQRYGIAPQAVTTRTRTGSRTDNIFLGVAVTCGLESVVLPFLDRGMSAEYELVRSLCTVTQPTRKKIGVLVTDAELFGRFDMQTMSARPTWPIIDELEKQYQVVRVDAARPISDQYDVLLAVQPSSLGPEPMDQFVQTVRRGVPTAIFEDPLPIFAANVPATSAPRRVRPTPLLQQPPEPKGDLEQLWTLLGIDFPSDQVVWQDYNPYPLLNDLPREFVFADSGSGAAEPFNERDPITSGLQHMLFPFPGCLAKRHASTMEFTALVRTGDVTGMVRCGEAMPTRLFGPGQLNPNRRQVLTGIPYVLAARIRGKVEPAETADDSDEAEEEAEKESEAGGHAAQPAEVNVVLVADIDMLHQNFFRLREQGDAAESGVHLEFDNVAFVLNALDVLAGDDRFLALRKRRGKHPLLARTPEQIEADRKKAVLRQRIQREFDEAVEREKEALAEKLKQLEKRLKQENLSINEITTRVSLAKLSLQRRLDATIDQLERKRDLDLSRIGRPSPPKPSDKPSELEEMQGQPLFPEFDDPLAAASLEIVEYDEAYAMARPFKVAQVEGRWSIPSHANYPADATDQLAAALTDVMDLRVLEVVSANLGDHELYGVVDPDPHKLPAGALGVGTRVTVKDQADNVLLAMVIGRQVVGRPELRYIRRVGQTPVYAVNVKTDNLSTRFEDWIEQDLLRLNTWDVNKVQIHDYSVDVLAGKLIPRSEFTVEYDDRDSRWRLVEDKVFRDNRWVLEPTGDDQKLNTAKLNELKWALDGLRIVDVRRKPRGLSDTLKASGTVRVDQEAVASLAAQGFYFVKLPDELRLLSKEGEVRVLMKDGVRYLLRFGEAAAAGGYASDSDLEDEGAADGSGLIRYLLVTAEFDPSAIPEPELEPLPDEPKPDESPPSDDRSDLQRERERIEKENQRRQEEYEAKLKRGQNRVQELNERFGDWCYLIPEALYRKIHLSRDQVFQEQTQGNGADRAG